MDPPGESGGEPTALAEMIFHSLSSPVEVVGGGAEGASVLGGASTVAARQTVHPGEEALFEPAKQLQYQEVFCSQLAS